jgi:hypothetical protein
VVDWHKRVGAGDDAAAVSIDQINAYRNKSGITM